ncbi:DMT family transporter [Vibrio proteolyticus]
MSRSLRPVVFMLSSTFSLSLTGLLSKYLAEAMNAQLLSFMRFVVPALMLAGLMMLTRFNLPSRSMWKPMWIRALCIAACQVCFIVSLQHLSLVESVVLFSTGPLFIPVLEKLIFSVRLSWLTLFGLCMTFGGVLLLAGDVSGIQLRPELLIGLAAGLFNAGSQLSLYRASKGGMRAIDINFWTFVCAAVLLFPVLVISGISLNPQAWVAPQASTVAIVVALLTASVLIVNTQVFRSKAYQLAESNSQLAPLIFTNLLFTAVWQFCFFDERFTALQLMGISLIVAASAVNVIVPKLIRRRTRSQTGELNPGT